MVEKIGQLGGRVILGPSAEFENGREYYAHHGKALPTLPANSDERPSVDLLRWHNQHIFESGA